MKHPALAVKPWRARNVREQKSADDAMRFFRTYLHHTKGKWAKQSFNVLPWEEHQVIRPLFGRLRANGQRQYRQLWAEVGKKSGKSELAAGIALKCLFSDHEPMAEVYIGAVDRDQAALIFQAAARMVRMSPQLSQRCNVLETTKRIVVTRGPQEGSFLEALASDADSADGKSPSCLIFDEVHRYRNREFYDTLIRSTAAREQPLIVKLTTAGTDPESLAWQEHEYARQVLEGVIEDPELLVVIYAAAPEASIHDWRSWQAANPSIGETVSWDYFEAEARKAGEDPANENSFRRFHLNQWVSQVSRWMPMDRWDASAGARDAEAISQLLQRVPSWGGLDLSQTRDLTALVLVTAPDEAREAFSCLMRAWIPEENVQRATKRDGVRYDLWIEQGFIRTTPGDTIDYDTIEREIRADTLRFPVQEIAFDPTFSWQLAQHLANAGISMWPIRQGFEAMSAPTADMLQLVKERRFEHASNPVMRWMADNVVVEQDSLGRWRPSKRKATKRIDGIVAAIMALDRAERNTYAAPPEEGDQVLVYDDRVTIGPRY